jgi:hypothetical protein
MCGRSGPDSHLISGERRYRDTRRGAIPIRPRGWRESSSRGRGASLKTGVRETGVTLKPSTPHVYTLGLGGAWVKGRGEGERFSEALVAGGSERKGGKS